MTYCLDTLDEMSVPVVYVDILVTFLHPTLINLGSVVTTGPRRGHSPPLCLLPALQTIVRIAFHDKSMQMLVCEHIIFVISRRYFVEGKTSYAVFFEPCRSVGDFLLL